MPLSRESLLGGVGDGPMRRLIELNEASTESAAQLGAAVGIVELDDPSEIRPPDDDLPESAKAAAATPRRRGLTPALFVGISIVAAVFSVGMASLYVWIRTLVSRDPIIAGLLAPFLLAPLAGVFWWLFGEVRSWRRL